MSGPADQFQPYLAADEPVLEAARGALVDGTTRTEGAVGVTDRRLLFVADEGFTDVRHEWIASVGSWPREHLTARGRGLRVLAAAGVALAVLSLAVQAFLTPTTVGSLLALVAVGGFAVAEGVRRRGVDVDWGAVAAAVRDLDSDPVLREDVVRQRWETEYVYAHQSALVVAALVGAGAAVALLVVAASQLAFGLTFVALGGLAATDHAVRRIRRLDHLGTGRRTERDVTIQLEGGHELTLRLDPAERVDRVLSRYSTAELPEQPPDPDPVGNELSSP